jgi:hypothetical protein
VTINVGQTKFEFYYVYNPDQVHADVSDYREQVTRKKKQTEASRERDRMIGWLVANYMVNQRMEGQPAPGDGNSRAGAANSG